MQVDNLNHKTTKHIRNLLINGADPLIASNPDQDFPNGKRPIDILTYDLDREPSLIEMQYQIISLLHQNSD